MRDSVKQYYGEVLGNSADLKTDACETIETVTPRITRLMAQIHPEVQSRYYGCGMVVPDALEGLNVLDLGCGAGRDCFLLAGLVGEQGTVTGIDMTPEQLEVARRHQDFHRQKFGYRNNNVRFLDGYLESLETLDIEPHSFDVAVSNCVINLCTDKPAVFKAIRNLLKPGGEMYFADVYADRRVPDALRSDPLLYGECLSGALYWQDFLRIAREAGFADPRLTQWRPIRVQDRNIAARVEPIRFFSATWRLFSIDSLESAREDYGQSARYHGTIDGCGEGFELDLDHAFEAGVERPVCGNTWRILAESRLAGHFELDGDFSRHLGPFEGAASGMPFSDSASAAAESSPGCC